MIHEPSRRHHACPGSQQELSRLGLGVLLFAALSSQTFAIAEEPHSVVSRIFDNLTSEMLLIDPADARSGAHVQELFRRDLIPHIDLPVLAQWVLRDHWERASSSEKALFFTAFENYLTAVYAIHLTHARDARFLINDDADVRKHVAIVSGTFVSPAGPKMALRFRLVRSDHTWRLFDISVQGVSLVRTMRAEFAAKVSRGGIPALVEYLETWLQ